VRAAAAATVPLLVASIRTGYDGQQRLRTILSFIKDGFVVSRRQNRDYGGLRYSQLPEEIQEQILIYELSVDLLINLPDKEVLDIFSRLNSYAVVLNPQEKINAEHFSAFKLLADEIARKYFEYWTKQGIFSDREILRMQEVSMVADLLIAMREGIKSKKQIRKFYDDYEKENAYPDDVGEWTLKFDAVIDTISKLYPEGLAETEFSRPHIYYSLFTAIAHCLWGLPRLAAPRPSLATNTEIEVARNALDHVGELFAVTDIGALTEETERQFMQDTRRATTDEIVRERRTKFLVGAHGVSSLPWLLTKFLQHSAQALRSVII
jgi:hypothetical protein